MITNCPKCGFNVTGAFPATCPNCTFSLTLLSTGGADPWQIVKWNQHTDILHGRGVPLYGKDFNASFDYNGVAKLENVLRFAVTYGDQVNLPSARGGHTNPAFITYIPEPIGSGTSIFSVGLLPCSGVCLLSPASNTYAHSFPIMDDWVKREFAGISGACKVCGAPTAFAQPVCANCYATQGGNWENFL